MQTTGQLLNEALRQRGRASCLSVRLLQDSAIAHLAAGAGFDGLYVDLEHALIPPDRAAAICLAARALGLAALVRVPARFADLGPLLDAGVDGLIITGVEAPAELGAILNACSFPPTGRRSINWSTPATGYRRLSDPAAYLTTRPYVAVMMESAATVKRAAEFATINGVDMLFAGCGDLALSLGLGGAVDSPEIEQACIAMAKACQNNGVDLGLGGLTTAPALVSRLLALGPALITGGSDQSMLADALHRQAGSLAKL